MDFPRSASTSFRNACWCYVLATVVWAVGIQFAAVHFPGSFQWGYTVISALASRKHNPEGAAWFAGAMLGAMGLLWPVVTHLVRGGGTSLRITQNPDAPLEPPNFFAYYAKKDPAGFTGPQAVPPRWVTIALRMGVVAGMFVGLERIVFYNLSSLVRKGHEIVALVSFLSFYAGVLGLYAHRVRTRRAFLLPAVMVVPLVGVGVREFVLYLSQRGVGWADYDWHGHGTPLWLSFAWWQWLAAVLLWLSFGHLLLTADRTGSDQTGL